MTKSRWLLRGAAVIALILPAALMLSPAASHASAVPSALFAAQARAAHLSATQQAALRREVNKIIARYGGHQIALNEIALAHDSSVLFPLPGQRVARVLPGTPPLPVNKAKIAHATKAAVSPAWSTGQTWYAPNGASCQFLFSAPGRARASPAPISTSATATHGRNCLVPAGIATAPGSIIRASAPERT